MSTHIQSIQDILLRDLEGLKTEILAYDCSADLWRIDGDIKNSAGNLALHLCGNLQFFVGSIIGKSGYERKRENEFSDIDLPREKLLSLIDQTMTTVADALPKLTEDQLSSNYPLEVFGKPMTYSFFLTHLTGHLMYHLGQINYHRRLLASYESNE